MTKTTLLLLTLGVFVTSFASAALDGPAIERASGLKGTLNEAEGVFKITAPRSDVKVTVDNWQMPPFMGLTSWAAFTTGKNAEAMVAGDLVVLQDEVNPVMSVLFEHGLSVTALHNHFFHDEPKVYFMHIGGEGTADKLATGVKAALDQVKAIRAAQPEPARMFGKGFSAAASSIPKETVEKILAVKAQEKDGMVKAVIGRKAKMECGCEVGKEMGVNTWAAFAGTAEDAIVDGDFVVLESELQPVLRSLRKDAINIVAIHHHMTGENPRYLFLHYWGRGSAEKLATAVKTALGQTAK